MSRAGPGQTRVNGAEICTFHQHDQRNRGSIRVNEKSEPPEPDQEQPDSNEDDGAAGTLEQPRREDEGGDDVDATVPDA